MIQTSVLRKGFEPAVPMFRQPYIIMIMTRRRKKKEEGNNNDPMEQSPA
jgi:hypothetical protein